MSDDDWRVLSEYAETKESTAPAEDRPGPAREVADQPNATEESEAPRTEDVDVSRAAESLIILGCAVWQFAAAIVGTILFAIWVISTLISGVSGESTPRPGF